MSTDGQNGHADRARKINPQLTYRQQELRKVLVRETCIAWMTTVLPRQKTDNFYPGSPAPKLQVASIVRKFCAGENFDPPLPHEMKPLGEGVWRWRTNDVRMVGWFPDRKTFVIAAIDTKANCTPIRDNEMYQEAIAYRNELGLNDGRFEEGEEIDDIIAIH